MGIRLLLSIVLSSSLFFSEVISSSAQIKDSLYNITVEDTSTPKDDLLEFSFKEIVDQKVSSPSKKLQRISTAPGTVSAYSSRDITSLGYYKLSDLAAITPGFSVNYQFGEEGFEIRGQTAGGFNNNKQVLLMIDGIPINMARSNKLPTQEDLPLFFADRVEFLKGPVAALYGVNAMKGVVSVFSKELSSNGTLAEGKFSGGTAGQSLRFMGNLIHRNNKIIASLNTGYYFRNPSRDYIGVTNNPGYLYWDQNTSFFIKTGYKIIEGNLKGLSLGLFIMQRKQGLGESWISPAYSSQVNDVTWSMVIPYLKFEKEINKNLFLYSFIKGNKSLEDGQYEFPFMHQNQSSLYSIYRSSVVNYEALSEIRYRKSSSTNYIIGIHLDRRYEQGNPNSYAYAIITPDSINNASFKLGNEFSKRSSWFNTFSAYSQFQKSLPVLKGLTITGGLNFNLVIIDTLSFKQFSPRIAIVQKITSKINLKLMTGQSMRAPCIKEMGLVGNSISLFHQAHVSPPPLAPHGEIFRSSELAFNYISKDISFSAICFYNQTYSEIDIGLIPIPYNNPSYSGSDSILGSWFYNRKGLITSKGFELDIKSQISKQYSLFVNASYALAKDQQNKYYLGIPLYKMNMGIMHTLSGRFKLRSALIVKYISGYTSSLTTLITTGENTLIDANFIVPFKDNLSIEIQARNLLNQKIRVPPTGIPLPRINFMFTLSVKC